MIPSFLPDGQRTREGNSVAWCRKVITFLRTEDRSSVKSVACLPSGWRTGEVCVMLALVPIVFENSKGPKKLHQCFLGRNVFGVCSKQSNWLLHGDCLPPDRGWEELCVSVCRTVVCGEQECEQCCLVVSSLQTEDRRRICRELPLCFPSQRQKRHKCLNVLVIPSLRTEDSECQKKKETLEGGPNIVRSRKRAVRLSRRESLSGRKDMSSSSSTSVHERQLTCVATLSRKANDTHTRTQKAEQTSSSFAEVTRVEQSDCLVTGLAPALFHQGDA